MNWDRFKNRESILGIVVFVFTLFNHFYLIPAQIMKPASVNRLFMSPRFFPMMINVIIAVFAVSLIFFPGATAKTRPEGEEKEESGPGFDYRKGIVTAISFFVYSFFLIQYLGFLTATIITLAWMIYYAGNRNWKTIILVSILVPLILVQFFYRIAYVPFPTGLFPW